MWADLDRLLFLDLLLAELRVVEPEVHIEILKVAFSRLIADRAVERVVGEQEFEHRPPAFFGLLVLGVDDHPFGHRCVAGDLELGILLHVDQADTAVAGDGESRVVAVARDEDAKLLGRLYHRAAVRALDFLAVDCQRRHAALSLLRKV